MDIQPIGLPPAFLFRPGLRRATFPPGEGFGGFGMELRFRLFAHRLLFPAIYAVGGAPMTRLKTVEK